MATLIRPRVHCNHGVRALPIAKQWKPPSLTPPSPSLNPLPVNIISPSFSCALTNECGRFHSANFFKCGIYIRFLKCYSRRLDPDIILSLVRKIAKNPKGTLTKADFEKVFDATFSGKNIVNIKPLLKLTSVSNLSLVDNEISDLKPLASLKNLVQLQLQGNQISALKPISDLVLLDQLNLSRNQISNIAPLKKLVNLERLNLINNKLTNIAVCANFPKLSWLGLNFNDITKLKPLYGLKNLEVLMIKGNTNLSSAEIMDLEDTLPNCTIEY